MRSVLRIALQFFLGIIKLDLVKFAAFHNAGVVKHMASCPLTNSHFIHVSDWCKAIDQMNDPRIEKHLIDKAQELKTFLLSSADHEYVCHGDLHGENIVSHHDTWLSIDPKGVIGEMAFEAAAFDLISKNDLLDLNSLQEKIIARVSALAHALEIDKNRLIAWIFLRMMISAQWFIEDHGNPDGMLQRASIIYPLITKRYHKDHVSQTYEVISDWFENHRCYELFEKPYLDQLISLIKPNGTLLDLGCGTGRPIAQFCIAQGLSVTGVDASQSLIAKARIHCPDLITIHQDMRTIDLQQKFDGIIAWHSFFHLPSDDQRAMFQTFKNHMNDGGILIFTSGPSAGEVWSDNGGQMLYHASLSQQEYQSLLVHHGFKILCHKPQDSACGNATIWMATYNP